IHDGTLFKKNNKIGNQYMSRFFKDFALGRAKIHEEAFSKEIRDLFLPEEVFYTKKRYFR
ncbi:MAG: hypothetical protein M3156_05055, partial [Thermoproteota archaeon]|nr:hypothetical protein [Thermoproteota archaeon]